MRPRSVPLQDGARLPSPYARLDRLPVLMLGMGVFGLWWIVGGKYTIDGLPLLLNELCAFLRAPRLFAPVENWRVYVALAWLPLCISVAERRYAPWRRLALSGTMIWVLSVWLIVSGIDAASTYLAVTNPPRDAYAFSKQLAASRPLAVTWSILTTFLPEAGMSALWRWWKGR